MIGLSRRPPAIEIPRARHISLDLSDRAAVAAAMPVLCEATHLVHAAVEENPADVEQGWTSRDQMQRNRDLLANLVDALCDVARRACAISRLCMGRRPMADGWIARAR